MEVPKFASSNLSMGVLCIAALFLNLALARVVRYQLAAMYAQPPEMEITQQPS